MDSSDDEKDEYIKKLFPVYIATSHFESMTQKKFFDNRKAQMHDTFKQIFGDEPNCIVVGDYNFDNQKEYETNIKDHNF